MSALNLTKGDKLNLQKENGTKLTSFCVGLNWGAILKKGLFGNEKKEAVDLDASAALFDENNQLIEIVSFRQLTSSDKAIKHSGDDMKGDLDGDDGLDNEIITVDLAKLNPKIDKVVFILNSFRGQDFADIPYAHIRVYQGTATQVNSIFAKFNISAESKFKGFVSMAMAKLYKHKGEWKIETIGEPTQDKKLEDTVATIQRCYL